MLDANFTLGRRDSIFDFRNSTFESSTAHSFIQHFMFVHVSHFFHFSDNQSFESKPAVRTRAQVNMVENGCHGESDAYCPGPVLAWI